MKQRAEQERRRKEGRPLPFRQFAPDLYKTQINQTVRTRPGTFWRRRTCKAENAGLPKSKRARAPPSSKHQGCSQNSRERVTEAQITPSVWFAPHGLAGKRSLASYSFCLKGVPKLGKQHGFAREKTCTWIKNIFIRMKTKRATLRIFPFMCKNEGTRMTLRRFDPGLFKPQICRTHWFTTIDR